MKPICEYYEWLDDPIVGKPMVVIRGDHHQLGSGGKVGTWCRTGVVIALNDTGFETRNTMWLRRGEGS